MAGMGINTVMIVLSVFSGAGALGTGAAGYSVITFI